MITNQKLWEQTLLKIQSEVSNANYTTWFRNTFIKRLDQGTVYLGVPNEFVREWLATKYHKTILKFLREFNNEIRNIQYSVSKRPSKSSISEKSKPSGAASLPLVDRKSTQQNLNPRYNFDSFVIGSFNELAYSASRAILNKPGVYNPLFIYGETGLGKTHLIQAVGNAFAQQHPDLSIFYTSSERFTSHYIDSVKRDRISSFKEFYRKHDVIIMDDIQFLSGKEKTQEELFHLFNALHDNNKQIIFSSDKHPNYIVGLENRLKSRFSSGMIVDVTRPEFESKVSILAAKAKSHNCEIQEEVLNYIASHVEGNIRELEGILNSLIAHVELQGTKPSLSLVQRLVRNSVKPKRDIALSDIIRTVANFYNVETDLLYEKTRRKEIVRSRQIAMYLLREDYSISFPGIGKEFGGRDHTTVIHSCDKIKRELVEDSTLGYELDQIRAMLTTR
jgi:chromosomal replication initiator protein